MPKILEEKLKHEAMMKFGTTESPAAQAYIYGTLMRYERAHKKKMMHDKDEDDKK